MHLLLTPSAFAQCIEVATIKPGQPLPQGRGGGPITMGCTGGPGSKDPGLYSCSRVSLKNLLTTAYDLKLYQISGPDWLETERFDISARVPSGATKEQMKPMVRNLLKDRFKLAAHHETRELPVYELVVAKNGPKLKTAAPVIQPAGYPAPPIGRLEIGKDGFPVFPAGRPFTLMMGDKAKSQALNQTTGQLAGMLTGFLNKPVTDATGLKEKYDYTLSWATEGQGMISMGPGGPPPPPSPDSGVLGATTPGDSGLPDIFRALQEQLGLKLEPKKGPVDFVVVDHIEKTPSEN